MKSGRIHVDRLSWKLGISIALLLGCGLATGFYLVYQAYWGHVQEISRTHALIETRLIRMALEHQMLHNERGLLSDMVHSFAKRMDIERVMVLDRDGLVQFSSDSSITGNFFDMHEPTCQVCHRLEPGLRASSTTLEVDRGSMLRCVEPIPNEERCHACHDPDHRINGVLFVDVPLEATREAIKRNVAGLALGTGLIGLLLLGGIGLVFRRLVLRRLRRFKATARAIAQGDLEQRVPVEGQDALSQVETQFNRMADSVLGLLSQLKERRAQLEKVMNSVDDGMLVLDRSLQVIAANEAFLRRFGVAAADVIGRRCCGDTEAEPGPYCGDAKDCPAKLCFESGELQAVVRSRTALDGSTRQEEVLISPIHGEDGRVVNCVEVWRDITDRRSAEARLAETQRLASLGMLASGFSHEVNTPLASIQTCLDGLDRLLGKGRDERDKDAEQMMRLVQVASEQVGRCGSITRQFLRLARGGSLRREILDLREVAGQVLRLVEPTAAKEEVSLEVEEGGELPSVLADPSAVQQVLMNLLLNAVEASTSGQSVRVSIRKGRTIDIEVADRGKGIAPEDLPRLFEPFFSRRENGTGLGLFVSMGLARSWGGDLSVKSTLGDGAIFTVVFPIAEETEGAQDGSDQNPPG